MVGIEILRDLRPSASDPGVWEGGTIYDPSTGRTYRATLRVTEANRLDLRGYVGIPLLGRTASRWRVGAEHLICQDRGRSMRRPRFIARQAGRPSGLLGRIIGRLMAVETAIENQVAIVSRALDVDRRDRPKVRSENRGCHLARPTGSTVTSRRRHFIRRVCK